MILFIILTLTLLFLLAFTVIALSFGGAVFIIIFGDVIVCAVLIIWLIKKIFFNKK